MFLRHGVHIDKMESVQRFFY